MNTKVFNSESKRVASLSPRKLIAEHLRHTATYRVALQKGVSAKAARSTLMGITALELRTRGYDPCNLADLRERIR